MEDPYSDPDTCKRVFFGVGVSDSTSLLAIGDLWHASTELRFALGILLNSTLDLDNFLLSPQGSGYRFKIQPNMPTHISSYKDYPTTAQCLSDSGHWL